MTVGLFYWCRLDYVVCLWYIFQLEHLLFWWYLSLIVTRCSLLIWKTIKYQWQFFIFQANTGSLSYLGVQQIFTFLSKVHFKSSTAYPFWQHFLSKHLVQTPSAAWCQSILIIADLLNEKSLTGHICCLDIWIPGLDSEELLESAECKRPGNVFSLADDNTAVFGSAIKLLGFHPEVDIKNNAGMYNKYWVDIWKDRFGMWC